MTLFDLNFDAIFIVNLKRRPERKEHIMKECEKMGITGKFIEAVDANALQISSSYNFTPGMVGCFLSHLFIMQMSVLNGYNRILVLEDDARFIDGAKSLLATALPMLPNDWGFVWLGYCVYSNQRHLNKPVNRHWIVPSHSWGTQAYMINGANNIKKIHNELTRMKYQVDVQLSYFLPKSKIPYYGIEPVLVKQLKGRSDVQ